MSFDPCKITENRPESWVLCNGLGRANDFEFSSLILNPQLLNLEFSTFNFEPKTNN